MNRQLETATEKESNRIHSKADPTMAMNEAEPSAVAASERALLAPLRAVQHRDVFGVPIAEPDKSNPTRSRWERPLDTIRSFEAAIDGPYAQRAAARPGSEADWNRRTSYVPRSNGPSRPPSIYSMPGPAPRQPQDVYHGGRPSSQYDPRSSPPARDSFHEMSSLGYGPYNGGGYEGHSGNQYYNRQPGSRSQLSPQYYNNRREPNDVYSLQNRDRSYETVTSASGSGISGDQGSYRTDPSSDNSSLDRASPPKPPAPTNDYGIGFSGPSTYQPAAFSVGQKPGGSRIVKKQVPGAGVPMATGPSVPSKGQGSSAPAKPEPEKRKSWLFRRFSKKT